MVLATIIVCILFNVKHQQFIAFSWQALVSSMFKLGCVVFL